MADAIPVNSTPEAAPVVEQAPIQVEPVSTPEVTQVVESVDPDAPRFTRVDA